MSKETDRKVEYVTSLYTQTRHTLETRAHTCTPDTNGRCKYCPVVMVPALAAQARTGELTNA